MAKNQKVTLHIKLSDGSVKDVSFIVPAGESVPQVTTALGATVRRRAGAAAVALAAHLAPRAGAAVAVAGSSDTPRPSARPARP